MSCHGEIVADASLKDKRNDSVPSLPVTSVVTLLVTVVECNCVAINAYLFVRRLYRYGLVRCICCCTNDVTTACRLGAHAVTILLNANKEKAALLMIIMILRWSILQSSIQVTSNMVKISTRSLKRKFGSFTFLHVIKTSINSIVRH
jgi:hypothetical protein